MVKSFLIQWRPRCHHGFQVSMLQLQHSCPERPVHGCGIRFPVQGHGINQFAEPQHGCFVRPDSGCPVFSVTD